MIFVNSFVVASPSQPVRDCGTVVSHAGTVPSQTTFARVGELVAAFVVSMTKQRFFATPSVANLGSPSWIIVMYCPGVRPVPVGTTPPTGNMLFWTVSMRQLFHVSGSQPPGPLCVPAETSPGSAMYWPQNDPSPETAAAAWLVGSWSSAPATYEPPGTMVGATAAGPMGGGSW